MAWTRRQFLHRTLTIGSILALDSVVVEPEWLEITHHDFRHLGAGKTLVHLTDIHYRGNRLWLDYVLKKAKEQKPDYLVVTGDLVSYKNPTRLREVMQILEGTGIPLFGCLGNHDPVDPASIRLLQEIAAATGGAWLFKDQVDLGPIFLDAEATWRTTKREKRNPPTISQSPKPRILLCHYPAIGDKKLKYRYDLILCGHSHGGQCRVPGVGAVFLPSGVGRYVMGHYDTPAGRMYVNRGIGTTGLPIRFACRPEMAVFRI